MTQPQPKYGPWVAPICALMFVIVLAAAAQRVMLGHWVLAVIWGLAAVAVGSKFYAVRKGR